MKFVLERWDDNERGWLPEASFATRAEARARAWELKLAVFRVRES